MHHFLLLSILHPLFVLTDGFDLLKALRRGDGGAASVRPVRWLSVGGRGVRVLGSFVSRARSRGTRCSSTRPGLVPGFIGATPLVHFSCSFFPCDEGVLHFVFQVGGRRSGDGWMGGGSQFITSVLLLFCKSWVSHARPSDLGRL